MIQATISLLLLLICLCACDTHADILGDLEADVPVPVLPEDNINSMTNSLYVPKSAPYPLDLMHQILETYRQRTEKEESSEKEKKTQILLKGRSTSLQASDKNKEQFEATSMLEPQSVSEKADKKNPKIYAFFKKSEGIHHKNIKPIPKSIVAACISVPGILVAMIILMHIVSSKYLKNKEEPAKINTSKTCEREEPKKGELKIISETNSKKTEKDTEAVKKKNQPFPKKTNQLPVHLSPQESKENGKHLKTAVKQPVKKKYSSINSPPITNGNPSTSAKPLNCEQPLGNYSSSKMKTYKNHRTRPRTSKIICHKPRQPSAAPEELGYKRHQDTDEKLPRHNKHRSTSTKYNTTHADCPAQDAYSSLSSPGYSSLDVSNSLDVATKCISRRYPYRMVQRFCVTRTERILLTQIHILIRVLAAFIQLSSYLITGILVFSD